MLLRDSSLSARRAWIEIPPRKDFSFLPIVALRKESVDRNSFLPIGLCRARVALRKESVDRNIWVNKTQSPASGRSPQGERG